MKSWWRNRDVILILALVAGLLGDRLRPGLSPWSSRPWRWS
jgi:hypothetical protein